MSSTSECTEKNVERLAIFLLSFSYKFKEAVLKAEAN